MFSVRSLIFSGVTLVKSSSKRVSTATSTSNIVVPVFNMNSTLVDKNSRKWEVLGAVCLERLPLITPPMKPIEVEMAQLIEKLDIKKSLKSDHELRQEEDLKSAKSRVNQEQNDPDAAIRQTAQDFEDACNEEFAKFSPHSRITEADLNGDKKSIERMLDRHLLFVVHSKTHDGKTTWILPQTQWQEGETLRQTVERLLKDHVTSADPVRILGNAPWGVQTIKYPASVKQTTGVFGSKIFFYKAQLLNGRRYTPSASSDYQWLGRQELAQFLEPEYLKTVSKFLIDED